MNKEMGQVKEEGQINNNKMQFHKSLNNHKVKKKNKKH